MNFNKRGHPFHAHQNLSGYDDYVDDNPEQDPQFSAHSVYPQKDKIKVSSKVNGGSENDLKYYQNNKMKVPGKDNEGHLDSSAREFKYKMGGSPSSGNSMSYGSENQKVPEMVIQEVTFCMLRCSCFML